MGKWQNAVAETLRRENIDFQEALERLEAVAGAPPEEGVADWSDDLEEVQAQLAEHFRLEEENGHLDSVRDSEPRLERAVRNLLEEHQELMESLEALLDEARAGESGEDFRHKVREWVVAVREHEARENVLVVDAVNLDIPAED